MTFLIMWTTYAAALILHASIDRPEIRDRATAIYACVAAIQIPIVYASVTFWKPEAQFHPDRIHLAPEFLRPLWLSLAALTVFFFLLWNLRTKIGLLEERRP